VPVRFVVVEVEPEPRPGESAGVGGGSSVWSGGLAGARVGVGVQPALDDSWSVLSEDHAVAVSHPDATPVTDRPVVVPHRYGLHLTRNARERVWLWERAVTCVGG
jgi:hypothetical protein